MKDFSYSILIPYLHPLFFLTLGVTVGIVSNPPTWLMVLSSIVSIVGSLYIIPHYRSHARLCCFIFIGCTIGALSYQHQLYQHKTFAQAVPAEPITIEGIITDAQGVQHPHIKKQYTISITSLYQPDKKPLAVGIGKSIYCYASHHKKLAIDEHIILSDSKIKVPEKDSFRRYLIKEGIYGTLFLNKKKISCTKVAKKSWNAFLHRARNNILNHFKQTLSQQSFSLIAPLFFGNKSVVKTDIQSYKNNFKTWGISHYLARSGLHMIIFIIILQGLLLCVPVPIRWKKLLLLCAGTVYAVLTWTSISFIRAFGIFVLHTLAPLLKKRSHFLQALILMWLAILVINPIQIFFLDFQLSFGLTFALAWLNTTKQLL